jgi:hypothetical protein
VTTMARGRKTKVTRGSRPGSLLAPQATGGLIAGRGLDFQARYAACTLPEWLCDPEFDQLLHEGLGDVSVRYQKDGKSHRHHFQVKDHEVLPREFKEAVNSFFELNQANAGVYRCFTLVAPSISPRLRPVEAGLARFRNAVPFYSDVPSVGALTRQDLDERLRKAGLGTPQAQFVVDFVHINVGHGALRDDERALDQFIANVQKHPGYADRVRASVQPAFAEVLRIIQGKRGAALGRAQLETALRSALAQSMPQAPERVITLWVHNWTREVFDPPADHVVDWSHHFDRTRRQVPSPDLWESTLLPELTALRDKLRSERAERVIRFRGKCSLSTGIALGALFPSVGGWTFEIPQPPAPAAWRSDVEPAKPYAITVDLLDGGGTDLFVCLSVRGDGREDVRRYIETTGIPSSLFATMSLARPAGGQSIEGPAEATAFAREARERLGQIIKEHGIRRTHLFFYGPFALAVFLGQQLTSIGELQLFEYQNTGYAPSCTIRT